MNQDQLSTASEREICDSSAIVDEGHGVRFEIREMGFAEPAFVIRYRGEACGFVNRCPHTGTELDWNPGDVFDDTKLYLICATHGALFEPRSGRCVAGPCRGDSLHKLEVKERDGKVLLITRSNSEGPR